MNRSQLIGFGHYLPQHVVTNDDLSKTVDTNDTWIRERTGIEMRHICQGEENTAYMGYQASLNALKNASLTAMDIDMIVLATTTPVHPFPATAAMIQEMLGAKRAFAFDIQAVCSGYIYALSIADAYIKTGQAKRVLVIGAEQMSKLVDWSDRGTCVLFGDGAGAVVLEACADDSSDRGIYSTHLYSDGHYYDILWVDNQHASSKTPGHIKMNGKEVYRHAVTNMTQAMKTALEHNQMTINDIDWLIPHQANLRILQSVAHNLNLPIEKVIVTLNKHANTSAATIPLALSQAKQEGRLKNGQVIGLVSMGAGATWGSVLLKL